MLKLLRVLAVAFAVMAVPALSQAQTLSTETPLSSVVSDIQNLPVQQVGAIVGGALIGGALSEVFLDGGIITVIGVILGAAAGNQWYQQHYWPF